MKFECCHPLWCNRRRVVVVLLLTLLCGACQTWQTQAMPPRQVIEERGQDPVRVTRTDGLTVVIDDPTIHGDSLSGPVVDDSSRGTLGGDSLTVAFSDISYVEVRRIHWIRTWLAFLPVFGVLSFCADYPGSC